MKMGYWFLRVILLMILPMLGRAQKAMISGHVVDSVTKKPILFASISLREEGNGGLTDGKGYFQLAGMKNNQDSLLFMKLGYSRRAVFVENDKTADLVIELNPQTITLADNCLHRPYIVDGEELRIAGNEVIYGLPGTQYAFFIGNEKHKQLGRLQAVSFYLGENGLPMKSFRIHIYKADGLNHAPGADLLGERMFLTATKGGEWYTSDLSAYNIIAPKEGYYVALEFGKPANSIAQPTLEHYLPAGRIMRPTFDFKKSITWSRSSAKDWRLLPHSSSSRRYNAMVKTEVAVVE